MAALTSAGVTIEDEWYEGNPNGRRYKVVQAVLVLSTQGGASNNIPASLLKLAHIRAVLLAVGSDDKAYLLAPSYDGTFLYSHTAVGGAAADITATVRVVVRGTEF